MSELKWSEIYAKALDVWPNKPAAPRGPSGPPKCETHCNGNHHYDGAITCVSCHGVAYRILAHEWIHMEGHYWYSHESVNGAPLPMPKEPTCTQCGGRKLMVNR